MFTPDFVVVLYSAYISFYIGRSIIKIVGPAEKSIFFGRV